MSAGIENFISLKPFNLTPCPSPMEERGEEVE
jgi:hypothetical protein